MNEIQRRENVASGVLRRPLRERSEGPDIRTSEMDMNAACGNSGDSTPDWDFGDGKEDPIHRIHAYPAKFPAFITTRALQYAERQGVKVDVVADVFCGCGTTAVEAKRNGKNFWGCDINPVATLIAQVKTHHYRDGALARRFADIRNEFRRAAAGPAERERINDRIDRIRYWFDERNIDDLLRLDHAIRRATPAGGPYRKFFLCAFSNILKATSRWLTKSIKAQLDPRKSPRGVMGAFENQVGLMRKANSENRFPTPGPSVRIQTRDFLAPRGPAIRADLIVTSPPYVTSYNYADIHQLSTLWLGYASDYRALRSNMVGNQVGARPPAPTDVETFSETGRTAYRDLLDVDACKARSIARYFVDLDRAVAKCWRMLSKGGMAVFVIGNTRYKGVRIDNKEQLAHCMKRANFQEVETVRRKVSWKIMTPYRDARGRFTQDAKQRRVYGEEFVVIGRRR